MLVKEFKKPVSGESVLIGPDVKDDIVIMALESSCDETACAIVKNGREVLAIWRCSSGSSCQRTS